MWDKSTFNLVSSSQGEFSITSIFQMVEGDSTWAFTGVYGPQARVDKLRFWEELQSIRDGWPKSGRDAVYSKLDRFLVSLDRKEQFPVSLQSRLPRTLPDHFSVKLERAKLDRGKVPFKFENMWLRAEGFSNLIKKWWEKEEVQGFASYVLRRNSRLLRWS